LIVMKFGGSSLKDPESLRHIAEIIKANSFSRRVVVLSAIGGITDKLIEATDNALHDEHARNVALKTISEIHEHLIQGTIQNSRIRNGTQKEIGKILETLKRLLKGISYTQEATPKTRDHILTLGERMSVRIMSGLLNGMKIKAQAVETDQIGLIAHGEYGMGSVKQKIARKNLPALFHPLLQSGILSVVTGFFGQTEDGFPITFGRGGSDYSAAILADALKAERLEVWKDVDGFLSGSPQIVKNPKWLSHLSYDEAAELSYFGASILHSRTVEPLLDRKIPIVVRNTFKPDGVGTWIGAERHQHEGIIKSVTYDRNIALLRLHGADVGHAVGLLSILVSHLSRKQINIRSVMTSQTCINILLDRKDCQQSHHEIQSMESNGIDLIEPIENIALVAVVGEGLFEAEGLVAKVIQALIEKHIHIELISSGASKVAAYFIVREERLEQAVKAVHDSFFN
jgi:aspartate kinase